MQISLKYVVTEINSLSFCFLYGTLFIFSESLQNVNILYAKRILIKSCLNFRRNKLEIFVILIIIINILNV